VGEAAELLTLSRSRLYELMYAGSLPSVKIGGARRIRKSDLEAYVNRLEQA
jgi:excisionase family DNA binding protein